MYTGVYKVAINLILPQPPIFNFLHFPLPFLPCRPFPFSPRSYPFSLPPSPPPLPFPSFLLPSPFLFLSTLIPHLIFFPNSLILFPPPGERQLYTPLYICSKAISKTWRCEPFQVWWNGLRVYVSGHIDRIWGNESRGRLYAPASIRVILCTIRKHKRTNNRKQELL